jgi:hypothetical protein
MALGWTPLPTVAHHLLIANVPAGTHQTIHRSPAISPSLSSAPSFGVLQTNERAGPLFDLDQG